MRFDAPPTATSAVLRKRATMALLFAVLHGVFVYNVTAQDVSQSANGIEFFEKRVRPVLHEHCYQCHGADAEEVKGGLRLDSRATSRAGGDSGPAVVPGQVDESLLIAAVNYSDGFYQMPPEGKLPDSVIADLVQWVRMGAPDPRVEPNEQSSTPDLGAVVLGEIDYEKARQFWAFQPPSLTALPRVQNRSWCRSPLDRMVLAELENADLDPAPEADRRTWLRRATYDLTGLPPTGAEIDAFLADQSHDAFARVVDRLLSSPRYGERWGRHWLDVARYADSNGLDENLAYASAFRYRDYVIDALNKDKPFDRFVHEQLAGDLLDVANNKNETEQQKHERLIATGFLSLGPKMLACDDGQKMELDIVDEQLDTTSRAFMGLTMGCARCHDHKFDPLSTDDYYSLAGVFKSTKTMENFKVVAQWHEYELPTEERRQAIALHKAKVGQAKVRIEQLHGQAQGEFLDSERARVEHYLRTAVNLTRVNGRPMAGGLVPIGSHVRPDELTGRGVLTEAEKFQKGTFKVDTTNWGKGIGVLLNSGLAEYKLPIPEAGKYQFELRYAAAESRPVQLSINGKVVTKSAAAEITGGWNPEHQRWHLEGVYPLQQGDVTIRLQRDSAVPHIDKLLLVRLDADQRETFARHARKHGLHRDVLKSWIQYLNRSVNSDGVLAELRSAATQHERNDVVDRLGRKLLLALNIAGNRDSRHPKQIEDPIQQLLFGEDGPFRVPPKPETHYSSAFRKQLKELVAEKKKLEKNSPQLARAMGVREGTIENMKVHIRGNYLTLGHEVPRRFPRVFQTSASIKPTESGRLALARWLTDPSHPLTARVIANRVWLWHFGQGLVRTPDNFGRLGERPTNQLLLDWLARRVVHHDWSLKRLHREIMLSSTYRISSRYDKQAAARDPENRLWWRFPRRRLAAEEIRDTVLLLGNELDLQMYGQLLPDKNRGYVTGTGSKQATYDFLRRSVYMPILRSAVYDVFQAFDFGDPSIIQGRRASTTVAPQAMFMTNSRLVQDQTRRLAQWLVDRQSDKNYRLMEAYRRVYGRVPSPLEVSRSLKFIADYQQAWPGENASSREREIRAWQGLCRVLVASNEFVYVE